ncbi:MAG: NAD(P)-dependent oxidoreductase [Oscillospiraceae bacterium]|nr:NAD(P)-dependent oxidoreductase [Oscillospiraceae bacterium]
MWTEEKLNELLTTPSPALVEDIKKIKGDIMVLGAGGKMGPTLCVLCKNAIKAAGIDKKVIAVSRGSDKIATKLMLDNDIEVIAMDLLDRDKLYSLPEVENVIYMAGRKFGTDGNEWQTWAMNSTLPAFVADKFKKSNIVVFSSGNIYPIVKLADGGCKESEKVRPIGEYAMSCLARERAFEYATNTFGTKIFIYRLNFAVDLRYGVLFDVANKIINGEPISLSTPVFNFIWQGSANEIAIRGLLHADSPAKIMNVTGPETVSIKKAALELGSYLGREPIFENEPGGDAYINDASLAMETFGYPSVPVKTLIRWQAEYIMDGGRTLDKPTHFEERKGSY